MTDKDTGGPAFAPMGAPDQHDPMKATYGMTLRDWFAGQALAVTRDYDFSAEDLAASCYRIADAMLAERSK